MATAVYLEHYLDSLETLPSELQRNFNLMRDLDTRVQGLSKNIEKLSQAYMSNAKNYTAAERTEHLENVRKMFEKAKEYGDDKVQLAMQTYEMVDKHIRRLDADLARFEAELKDKVLNVQGSDSESATKKRGRKTQDKLEKKKSKRGRSMSSDDEVPKPSRKKLKDQQMFPSYSPSVYRIPLMCLTCLWIQTSPPIAFVTRSPMGR
ncbi:inhibitor of growth protein 4 isoform X2 [Rhipicephalus sanguineus]|uniref:inhibitor of growth protein 4 isoform X2 n=1 Tax=Rhipicephalus sanguineus TaxID=34632 RepID=UPI001894FCF3|nr:inhibitor of growth protein 4 isoform X2 [Rhipicephalus sanguineus]